MYFTLCGFLIDLRFDSRRKGFSVPPVSGIGILYYLPEIFSGFSNQYACSFSKCSPMFFCLLLSSTANICRTCLASTLFIYQFSNNSNRLFCPIFVIILYGQDSVSFALPKNPHKFIYVMIPSYSKCYCSIIS